LYRNTLISVEFRRFPNEIRRISKHFRHLLRRILRRLQKRPSHRSLEVRVGNLQVVFSCNEPAVSDPLADHVLREIFA